MKHLSIYLAAICVIVFIAVINFGIFFRDVSNDDLFLRDSVSVRHVDRQTQTDCTSGGSSCAVTATGHAPTADAVSGEIKIDSPAANQLISSPLEISGQALGSWYFEAVFPIQLLGDKGQVLATGQATAQSDWTVPGFVPFKAELKFSAASSSMGVLVFSNDNPSGLPQNEKEYGVPVRLSAVQQLPISIFFSNVDLGKGSTDCNLVFPVVRTIIKTPTTARAALEQLLSGTTDEEKTKGYFTSINPGVKINKLTIANGTAKVDFDSQMDYQMGGSCRVASIRAQITQTLEQFPTVKNVIISVNGNVDEALQP